MTWKRERQRHQMAARGIKTNPQITNRQLIYGDFDKDGTLNIDDSKPFDDKDSSFVTDFPLTKDFIDIENKANEHKAALNILEDDIQNQGFETKSRIKTLHSIINKLKRKHLDGLNDFAGLLIIVKDEKEAKKVGKYLEKSYEINKKEDMFKKPGLGGYQALHYDIEIYNKPIEVQIKTKKQYKQAQKTHSKYKMGQIEDIIGGE